MDKLWITIEMLLLVPNLVVLVGVVGGNIFMLIIYLWLQITLPQLFKQEGVTATNMLGVTHLA